MASNEDDLTNCPVCFEDYQEGGDHIPRALPCFHTFCEVCIKGLVQGNGKLECPECRERYEAKNGPTTFPQNKYVLSYLRKMKKLTGDKVTEETVADRCQEHNDVAQLFCRSLGCVKAICQTCLLQGHKTHDFVDINEGRKQQSSLLVDKLERLHKLVEEHRDKVAKSKVSLECTNFFALKDITAAKEFVMTELNKRFDKMIKVINRSNTECRELDEEMESCDEDLANLDRIRSKHHKNDLVKKINRSLESAEHIDRLLQKRLSQQKILTRCQYVAGKKAAIDELCGDLILVISRLP